MQTNCRGSFGAATPIAERSASQMISDYEGLAKFVCGPREQFANLVVLAIGFSSDAHVRVRPKFFGLFGASIDAAIG